LPGVARMLNRVRHAGPVSDHIIIVGDRFMTAEAFLNEASILAVRLVISTDEARRSHSTGLFALHGIFEHKLHLNECGG
jgi:hypothetical protein